MLRALDWILVNDIHIAPGWSVSDLTIPRLINVLIMIMIMNFGTRTCCMMCPEVGGLCLTQIVEVCTSCKILQYLYMFDEDRETKQKPSGSY